MIPENIVFREKSASRDEIHNHLLACSASFSPPLGDRVDLREYARKLFERSVTFEAWWGNSLIGLVAAYLDRGSSDLAYITNVSVAGEFRGMGIAKALMERCVHRAEKEGFRGINLEVSKESTHAVQLYEAFGFRESKSDGGSLHMQLRLDEVRDAGKSRGAEARAPEKQRLQDLAVCGAAPAFPALLHVGRPNLPERQRLLDYIGDTFDRRWLTNFGPNVTELNRRVAERMAVKHCLCMCNGTIALEIAIRALELSGEVIVPAFTFVATAHALQWQGITPVFCDVDPVTHNLDPRRVEELITPRTTGMIGVHLWGRGCDVEALHALAEKHSLKLLFDAAHAFGCSHKGKMIGGFGNAEVLSFHATKFFNTFEGGAVLTNDDALAEKMGLMENFGFKGYDNVVYLGTNGKMNEVSAAMGLASLESMDQFIATNRRNYEAYRKAFRDAPGIRLIEYDPREKLNYQYVVIEVLQGEASLSRDELVQLLHAENVLARRYFFPGCHKMEPYRSLFPDLAARLPVTEGLAQRVMAFPNGTAVGPGEIAQIGEILRTGLAHGPQVKEALSQKGL